MSHDKDYIIIKKVKHGDISAFATLVNKYQNMAYTLAISITKNKEDAEEVAQDAFVKAYKNLDSFKGKSKFSTWLYQIIYNTALSKVRIKKKLWQNIDDKKENELNLSSKQVDSLERLDKKKIIKAAINKLKEDESFLLILYYYQELSIDELAQATGLSISNVKVKLHRARKNMYEQLQVLMNGHAKSLLEV